MRQLAFDDPGPSRHLEPTAGRLDLGRRSSSWSRSSLAVALWVVSIATGGFGADNRTVPSDLQGATSATAERALSSLDLRWLIHKEASSTVEYGVVIRATPGRRHRADEGRLRQPLGVDGHAAGDPCRPSRA